REPADDGASNLWRNVLVLCKARNICGKDRGNCRGAIEIVEGALLQAPCKVGRYCVAGQEQGIHQRARRGHIPPAECGEYARDTGWRNTGPVNRMWGYTPMCGLGRLRNDRLDNPLARGAISWTICNVYCCGSFRQCHALPQIIVSPPVTSRFSPLMKEA